MENKTRIQIQILNASGRFYTLITIYFLKPNTPGDILIS